MTAISNPLTLYREAINLWDELVKNPNDVHLIQRRKAIAKEMSVPEMTFKIFKMFCFDNEANYQ